jgi:hypothetical protein
MIGRKKCREEVGKKRESKTGTRKEKIKGRCKEN